MAPNTIFESSSFIEHLSETQKQSASEIAAIRGCSLNTAKNALRELQKMNIKGWSVKSKKLGRTVLWWKEKQLTDDEVREKEIGELKRLMAKYKEEVIDILRKMEE